MHNEQILHFFVIYFVIHMHEVEYISPTQILLYLALIKKILVYIQLICNVYIKW